jgi:hypothetical protein
MFYKPLVFGTTNTQNWYSVKTFSNFYRVFRYQVLVFNSEVRHAKDLWSCMKENAILSYGCENRETNDDVSIVTFTAVMFQVEVLLGCDAV